MARYGQCTFNIFGELVSNVEEQKITDKFTKNIIKVLVRERNPKTKEETESIFPISLLQFDVDGMKRYGKIGEYFQITGKVISSSYQDKKTGEIRYFTELQATKILGG